MKRLRGAESKLEKAVQRIVNRHAADYDSGVEGFMADLSQGGCISGMVGGLVYYSDTVRFFKRHREEINERLGVLLEEVGPASEVFGERWDNEDPLALGVLNQNLLAWFAFEETAWELAQRAGLEV